MVPSLQAIIWDVFCPYEFQISFGEYNIKKLPRLKVGIWPQIIIIIIFYFFCVCEVFHLGKHSRKTQ